MSQTHKLECLFDPGNGWYWVIKGLPDKNEMTGETEPDTRFWLVGLNHACDTPNEVVLGVYEAVYDHHQCSSSFKDGDTIESVAVTINKYHSYSDRFGTIDVPAIHMTINSFHVVLDSPEIEDEG